MQVAHSQPFALTLSEESIRSTTLNSVIFLLGRGASASAMTAQSYNRRKSGLKVPSLSFITMVMKQLMELPSMLSIGCDQNIVSLGIISAFGGAKPVCDTYP